MNRYKHRANNRPAPGYVRTALADLATPRPGRLEHLLEQAARPSAGGRDKAQREYDKARIIRGYAIRDRGALLRCPTDQGACYPDQHTANECAAALLADGRPARHAVPCTDHWHLVVLTAERTDAP